MLTCIQIPVWLIGMVATVFAAAGFRVLHTEYYKRFAEQSLLRVVVAAIVITFWLLSMIGVAMTYLYLVPCFEVVP